MSNEVILIQLLAHLPNSYSPEEAVKFLFEAIETAGANSKDPREKSLNFDVVGSYSKTLSGGKDEPVPTTN